MDLLGLPPEIRNIIYKLVLPTGERFGRRYQTLPSASRRSGRNHPIKSWSYLSRPERPGLQPGLLMVSKQVRLEAAPIFYANNTFVIREKLSVARWRDRTTNRHWEEK